MEVEEKPLYPMPNNDIARLSEASSDAFNLIHNRVKAGTATAQEAIFLARFGTPDYELEKAETEAKIAKTQLETEKIRAQTKAIHDAEQYSLDMSKVFDALKVYQGRN